MTQHEQFVETLTGIYAELFETDGDYAYSKARITPSELARKMTNSLATGDGNKAGKGIKRACKVLGVQYTYTGIRAYLTGN